MTLDHDRPYFNQRLAACRRAGTIGGRRSARNRRLRQTSQVHGTQEDAHVHLETAAEAIALIDPQFPWLRGAERRAFQQAASGLAHNCAPGAPGAPHVTVDDH